MTTFADRPNTAVLVVDVQEGVVANAHDRQRVIQTINSLTSRARDADVPVIWVQHADDELVEGSADWALAADLDTADNEPVVHKNFGDSFEDTTLEAELHRLAVGKLIITGAQTDACIRNTLHGAIVRGYDTVLVSDAHTTDDYSEYGMPPADKVIAHTNMYWGFQSAPGRTAEVSDAASLAFSPRASVTD